jgi:hypothetical protein
MLKIDRFDRYIESYNTTTMSTPNMTKAADRFSEENHRKTTNNDVIRLNQLKKMHEHAMNQDAQWELMYFIEDYTDEIREILARLKANGCHRTFPGIFLTEN